MTALSSLANTNSRFTTIHIETSYRSTFVFALEMNSGFGEYCILDRLTVLGVSVSEVAGSIPGTSTILNGD